MSKAEERSRPKNTDPAEELKWLVFDDSYDPSSKTDDLMKKISGTLVGIGMAGTSIILIKGFISMLKGDSRKQQMMMRKRVLAQGCTFAIAFVGFFYSAAMKKRTMAKVEGSEGGK